MNQWTQPGHPGVCPECGSQLVLWAWMPLTTPTREAAECSVCHWTEHRKYIGEGRKRGDSDLDPREDSVGMMRQDPAMESYYAAVRIAPKTGTLRWKVLTFLLDKGPATDKEIQSALGLTGNTERPRRVELLDGGWVESVSLRPNKTLEWGATEKARRNYR